MIPSRIVNPPAEFWAFSAQVIPRLLPGALLTLELTAVALLLGIVCATVAALMRIAKSPVLRSIAGVYVTVIRGTPALLQVLFVYDALPAIARELGGDTLGKLFTLDGFTAGALALGVNAGAYIAEIIRAAIQSIDRGQMEAARSLGMSHNQAMWRIIIPQTFRRLTPPMVNEAVALLKDTSLVGMVAINELLKTGKLIFSTTFRWEAYIWVAVLYLIMTIALSLWANRLEARLEARE